MIRIITGADAEIGQWIGEHLQAALGTGAVLGFADPQFDRRRLRHARNAEASSTPIAPEKVVTRRLKWIYKRWGVAPCCDSLRGG
jgi:hypothetical protein